MEQDKLKIVLARHKLWLDGTENGKRAVLCFADLRGADMSGDNLSYASLQGANLSNADLSRSDLRNVDLGDANLSNANLRSAIGNMREVRSMQIDRYSIVWTSTDIWIGCQTMSISDAWNVTPEQAEDMARGAGEWWKKWKDLIKTAVELSMTN